MVRVWGAVGMLMIQMMLGYEGNWQERNGQRGTGMVANRLKSEWQVGHDGPVELENEIQCACRGWIEWWLWDRNKLGKWCRILIYSGIGGSCDNNKCWWNNRDGTRAGHFRGEQGIGGWMGTLFYSQSAHFDLIVKGGCPKSVE
jgi:hypothetical protein